MLSRTQSMSIQGPQPSWRSLAHLSPALLEHVKP